MSSTPFRSKSGACFLAVLLAPLPGLCQGPTSAPAASAFAWVGGYHQDLGGVTMDYESALPHVRSALIVRSRREEPSIAWATELVPASGQSDELTFAWLFGMDVDVERHTFTLRCLGQDLRFHNPAVSALTPWEVTGNHGLVLRFRPTRLDRHGDVFGFATLRVPRALVTPGQSVRLEVTGDSTGSRIWYMTFRASPRAEVRLLALPALRRGAEPRQPLWLDIVHLGEPTQAVVECAFAPPQRLPLVLGTNRLELLCPSVTGASREAAVTVRLPGGAALTANCTLAPVRPWTVHLVQHTHTDIGYTRPQTEILPEHLRYLDYALDYCDQTDALPEDAKFRWTCEAAWAVREYLRARPQDQVERLRKRIADGRIEVTALFANSTELLDERSCAASLSPLQALREAKLPVVTAMQDDVNGVAWCYADLLPDLGVRYLGMGENGHRALIPFALPTAFWWESPTGKRLLAWRADHYMTGNLWGLHTGREDMVAPALFRYLDDLQAKGYPFDRIAVQYSGTILDNSPPGTLACELLRRWNERYEWPRLRSSIASEFLSWVEKEHGTELSVHRRAWPDWWSDGLGSAPRETAAARQTQDCLNALEAVLGSCVLLGAELPATLLADLERTRQRLVMYGEHTYGAAESISDPDVENSVVQWSEKAAYVWEAVKETALLQETTLGLLQPFLPRTEVPTLAIVNPRGEVLDGMVRVYIDHALLPQGRSFRVVDARGADVPTQFLSSNPDGTWWGVLARGVPPLGIATYRLEVGAEPAVVVAAPSETKLELENRFYRLRFDPKTGALLSWFDQVLQQELVDQPSPWHLGQLVHETLGDRAQLERLRLERCAREPLQVTSVTPGVRGALFRSMLVRGKGPICPAGFEVEVRLFEQEPRLELHYRVMKRRSVDPEALYVAFPFAPADARLRYETCGGMVDPEHDLLPGTASDWQAVQGCVEVRGAAATVLLASRENLLYQFGGLDLGRFAPTAKVERPHAFAWLLNNYWVTNFLASQEGELRWSFVLTSRPSAAADAALRFGLAEATLPLARVLPAASGRMGAAPPAPALRLDAPGVVLKSLRPDRTGKTVVLHLQAPLERPARVALAVPVGARLQRVTVLEDPLAPPAVEVLLGAGESAFVRVLHPGLR